MPVTRTTTASFQVQFTPQIVEVINSLLQPVAGGQQVGPGLFNLANGSSAGQISKAYLLGGISFAASGNQVIDLTAVTWPNGDALAFAKIMALLIQNTTVPAVTANGHSLVAGGGSNPVLIGSSIPIPAGGFILLGAGILDPNGWPVTGSTGMNLKLLSVPGSGETGACTANVVVLGQ